MKSILEGAIPLYVSLVTKTEANLSDETERRLRSLKSNLEAFVGILPPDAVVYQLNTLAEFIMGNPIVIIDFYNSNSHIFDLAAEIKDDLIYLINKTKCNVIQDEVKGMAVFLRALLYSPEYFYN